MTNAGDRRDYDVAASQNAQDNFHRVAGLLEGLIDQRDRDVQAAMADYLAEGVSEQYRAKEVRWHNAAGEVRGIIQSLRSSLERNDETAQESLRKARAAMDSIG